MIKNKDEQNQEVAVALELLISTLANERKRIYEVGANAMKAQDGDTAQAVINFTRKLEIFQKKVKLLSKDWSRLIEEKVSAPQKVQEIVEGDGKLFGMRTRNSKSGFTLNVSHKKAHKTNFSVKFLDGKIISEPQACDTFVRTIEYIGVSKVQKLGLFCNGEALVSNVQSKKYKASSKKTNSGLYVQTMSSTKAKIQYLQTIAKLLNIQLIFITDNTRS